MGKILWADDEIELLKPHILFLESKGYKVDSVTNGIDAVEKADEQRYDVIFLDENMPGISGLEALSKIKEANPLVPVVMITKSEEEFIMEEAIGSKIADYLIKPVNPSQILLSLKKILNQAQLVSQKTNVNYQQEFRQLGMQLNNRLDANEWTEMYKKLVYWELELEQAEDKAMKEIFEMQKKEANQLFCDFIEDHYLVIDNLRYDQWKVLEPFINKSYQKEEEYVIYSILPTATHYARNAFFAGLLPSEIEKKFPQYWRYEEDEGSKNQFEKELLEQQLKRLSKQCKWSYHKITHLEAGKKLNEQFNQIKDNDVNFVVYNFVDMLSHARTDMEVIRELANDEAAYRSLTKSWFEHSPLHDLIQKFREAGVRLIITTDHGTVKVTKPVKIVGERNTNTNLRYKVGRGLSYDKKDVFVVNKPTEAFLPQIKLSNEYVFAREADFFVYPNNYNHFVNHYGDTFQHGGISMEEMLIPFIELQPK